MSEFFYPKIFSFLDAKFSIYLNRHVFVMWFKSGKVLLICICTSENIEVILVVKEWL